MPRSISHALTHLTAVLLLALATTAAADDETAIQQLLDGLHADAANASFADYFARYTDDAVFLGTDKSERWTVSEFKAYAKPHFDAGRGWTYQPLNRSIMGAGDIRWFDELLHSESYGHCRGTGVVKRTPTGWKIAHYSLSFLIPNAAADEATALGIAAEAAAQP